MENKIDSYKIFESVARNESISKASEELFISQPAVSQSIKKLEETIGGELFNRTKYGVKLTTEGRTFYEHIKKGLDYIENGERIFTQLKNLEIGTLKIGASTTITKHILMPYLKDFHKLHPKINIDLVNNLSNNLISMLKNGTLDFAILNLPIQDTTDLIIHPFTTVQDIFTSTNEYMDTSKIYTLSDLKKYNLITQKRPSNTRSYLDTFLKEQNIKLTPSIESVSSNIVCDLTKIGFGYSYLTKEFIQDELDKGTIHELKTNSLPPKREIGLVLYKNNYISYASKKFMEIILKR